MTGPPADPATRLDDADPDVAAWAAAKVATAADGATLDQAVALLPRLSHSAQDRVFARIAAAGRRDLAGALHAQAGADAACPAAIHALLALDDPEGPARAGAWLDARRREAPEGVPEMASLVRALATRPEGPARTAARAARDGAPVRSGARLLAALAVLASTGELVDADAVVAAWLAAPLDRLPIPEAVVEALADVGLAVLPGAWLASGRRPKETLAWLAVHTDAALDAMGDAEARADLVRHWQKGHVQELVARLRRSTRTEHLVPALRHLSSAFAGQVGAVAALPEAAAADIITVLLGAALVSHGPDPDAAATLAPDALVDAIRRARRHLDPRGARALLARAAALGAPLVPALGPLAVQAPGTHATSLAIAALLRIPDAARVPWLLQASRHAPPSLQGGLLDALADAGAAGLPALREALAAAPKAPTPALLALAHGGPPDQVAPLLVPLLPDWLARDKARTLALCAALGHEAVIPALEADYLPGELDVGAVLALLFRLSGEPAKATALDLRPPAPPSTLAGPDGRPLPPPLRLLLRCVACNHAYRYELRALRVSDAEIPTPEPDGPPGPPPGVHVDEPVTCRRCHAVDRYRFTTEASAVVAEVVRQEMMAALMQQYEARARGAARQRGPGGPPGPPGAERLTPGGIILP